MSSLAEASVSKPVRVVIVGGGISGLAFAERWKALCREFSRPCNITLLESRPRLGGMIHTRRENGLLMEEGPESFLTEKPWAYDLSRRLGLESDLLPTRSEHRRSFVVSRGRLCQVPEGFYMLAPARIPQFLASGLLSWRAKIRTLAELLIPPRRETGDESVASFVRRRFGSEVLDRVAQAMIGGIYSADPEQLSLLATFPKFAALEQEYGSVIRGLRHLQAQTANASGPRYGLFMTFRSGMDTLVTALEKHLARERILTGKAVSFLDWNQEWKFRLTSGELLEADVLCLAVPAAEAARLLAPVDNALSVMVSSIPAESAVTVNLAYEEEPSFSRTPGFGFVVPSQEKLPILGCTFSSYKYEGRAPSGYFLLRVFFGEQGLEGIDAADDAAVADLAHRQLVPLLGLCGRPSKICVSRFPGGMPQYRVGHRDKVMKIQRLSEKLPGLGLCSNSYDGIGIPDCVRRSGEEAVRLFHTQAGLLSGEVHPGHRILKNKERNSASAQSSE